MREPMFRPAHRMDPNHRVCLKKRQRWCRLDWPTLVEIEAGWPKPKCRTPSETRSRLSDDSCRTADSRSSTSNWIASIDCPPIRTVSPEHQSWNRGCRIGANPSSRPFCRPICLPNIHLHVKTLINVNWFKMTLIYNVWTWMTASAIQLAALESSGWSNTCWTVIVVVKVKKTRKDPAIWSRLKERERDKWTGVQFKCQSVRADATRWHHFTCACALKTRSDSTGNRWE